MSENDLALHNPDLPSIDDLAAKVHRLLSASWSENTRKAYEADFRRFEKWCTQYNAPSLPASSMTVAAYIAAVRDEGKKSATITRYIASIAEVHKATGFPSPIDSRVKLVMKGLRKTIGTLQSRARPILPVDLTAMMQRLAEGPQGIRDRVLVLLGFSGAFRRSELVALDRCDVSIVRQGLEIFVRRSKTDQEGHGRKVAIPYGSNPDTCPVRAMFDWLEILDVQHPAGGALFRRVLHGIIKEKRACAQAVNIVVQRLAESASLPDVSAHSLRAGLATTAYLAGKSDRAIMEQGRWTSTASVNRYIRDGKLWKDDNAAGGIGL